MLTQLTTIKSRLGIAAADVTNDTLLTRAIEYFSARFDRECNRTLARTVDASEEFSAGELEIPVTCYPIETITRFELQSTETLGWIAQPAVEYIIRRHCVVSLATPLPRQNASEAGLPRRSFSEGGSVARLIYTGGYLLPGSPRPDPPVGVCQDLPADLENAAIEQVAFWFANREKLGEIRNWPAGGNYVQLADTDLLPSVRAILKRHTRFTL